NGSVGFSVAANPGGSRTGTLTIAGLSFTVTQAGATSFVANGGPRASERLQIDLGGVVDRDGGGVLHDHVGCVGVVDRTTVHVGVAVEHGVEIAGTEGERVDQLACVQPLSGACDSSGSVEPSESLNHHLGVDAK